MRELHKRYNKKKEVFKQGGVPTNEILVFHGSAKENIENIVRNGFKIGGVNGHRVTNGQHYGQGIYTDKDGLASPGYCCNSFCLVACKALPGNDSIHSVNPSDRKSWVIFRSADQLLPCYVIYFEQNKNYEPLLPWPQQFTSAIEELSDEESMVNKECDEKESETVDVEETKETEVETIEKVEKSKKKSAVKDDYAAVEVFSASLSNASSSPTSKAIQKQLMRVLRDSNEYV